MRKRWLRVRLWYYRRKYSAYLEQYTYGSSDEFFNAVNQMEPTIQKIEQLIRQLKS